MTGVPLVARVPREGRVPVALADATWTGPVFQIAPGRVLVDLPGVARVLVSDAALTVERADGAIDEDVAWLLDGPIAELTRLRGGEFALRAAGVVIGGRAVAIAGPAASGKSASAAALARRGHRVLADRELVVGSGSSPVATPGSPVLELWPDIVALLGLDRDAGAVVRPRLVKRAHRFAPQRTRVSLAAVVVLSRESDVGAPAHERVHGSERVPVLYEHTVGTSLIEPLGLRAPHFAWCAPIAGAVDVTRLRVDRHHSDLDAVAEAIEELVAV